MARKNKSVQAQQQVQKQTTTSQRSYDPNALPTNFNINEVIDRSFHALSRNNWDEKAIAQHVGMDQELVRQRLTSARQRYGTSKGRTSDRNDDR